MALPGEQVAGGVIDALRSQPLSLALVIMNLGLLGFLYYNGVTAHEERALETKLLYENRAFVGKLLAECQPTPRKGDN